jgi:Ala-tRNA(Pro) deacylase
MHGFHIKNLFLRDKKKKNYLVIAHEDSLIDLNLLTERIKSSRLSFGSKERLFEELGVFPGAVTPLSVVNNTKKDINIFLDVKMLGQSTIFCHPLVNDKTISLSYNSLLTFFDYLELSFETISLKF